MGLHDRMDILEKRAAEITDKVDNNFAAVVDCLGTHKEGLNRLEIAVASTTRREAHNDLEERVAELEAHRLVHHGEIIIANKRIAALEAKLEAPPLPVPELWSGVVIKHQRKATTSPPPLKFGQRVRHLRDNFEGTYIPRPTGYAAVSKGGHEFTYMISDTGKIYGAYPWNVVKVG